MVGVCFNFGREVRLRLGRLSSEHSGLLVAATGTLARVAAVLSCCGPCGTAFPVPAVDKPYNAVRLPLR